MDEVYRIEKLRDGRKKAPGAKPLARSATLRRRLLEHGRPAEVAALGTFGRLEVIEPVATGDTSGAAVEAFDDERLHALSIGLPQGIRSPPIGGRAGDGQLLAVVGRARRRVPEPGLGRLRRARRPDDARRRVESGD